MPPTVVPLESRIPVAPPQGKFPFVARETVHIKGDGGRWVVCVPTDPKAPRVGGAHT
jgi:hypothetical protein